MKGKLSSAVTASPLIVWFCGFSILINVLTNSFESLPYPFYGIIADPVKRTEQNKTIFLMQWKPSRSLWNYNFLSVSGRKHTAFVRACRQRGCRHIIVSGRNSSITKGSLNDGTEPSLPCTQAAFGHKNGPWAPCASKSVLRSGTASYYGGN